MIEPELLELCNCVDFLPQDIEYPTAVFKNFDGDRVLLYWEGETFCVITDESEKIVDSTFDYLKNELEEVFSTEAVFEGVLTYEDEDGEPYDDPVLVLLDVYSDDTYFDRVEMLEYATKNLRHVTVVETYRANSVEEVVECYKLFKLEDDTTGVVIRDVFGTIIDDDYAMYYIDEIDQHSGVCTKVFPNDSKNLLGFLELCDDNGTTWLCQEGFTKWERAAYWTHPQNIIGKIVVFNVFNKTPELGVTFEAAVPKSSGVTK